MLNLPVLFSCYKNAVTIRRPGDKVTFLKFNFWEMMTVGERLLDSSLKESGRWRRHLAYSWGLGWVLSGSPRAALIMQRLLMNLLTLWFNRDPMNMCSTRAWWQVEPLFWVTALNSDASPLLKSFIKMKLKPRDLKALFQIGKCNYFSFWGQDFKKTPYV